jgi:hypothetical protein
VLSGLDQGLASSQTQADLERIFELGPQALTCAGALSGYLTPVIQQVNPHIGSLDTLLSEFITATGYNSSTMNGIDTLRIDPTLPPSSPEYTSNESGGLAQEHKTTHFEDSGPLQLPSGLANGCPS